MKPVVVLAIAATFLAAAPGKAALGVSQTGNIAAGIAGFGPSVTVLDWSAAGAPGSASGSLAFANWIDGTGFDLGANPAIDLAINGVENVTWNFATPVSRIGFAIATGLGRLPGEVDNTGAVFNLLASNGETAVLTLVDPGNGYAAWVEITSATPFTSLQWTEVGSNIKDQYWGNVAAALVPEPESWALLIAGFGMVGAAMRRARHTAVPA